MKWKTNICDCAFGEGISSTAAIGPNGLIFIATEQQLHALNQEGYQVWQYQIGKYPTPPVVGNNGIIYIGSQSYNVLYAISTEGKLKWKKDVGSGISYPIIGSNGRIYIGSRAYDDGDEKAFLNAIGSQTSTFIKKGKDYPDKFELIQNYPNPFNPTTQINFSLPRNTNVELAVYDIVGRKVETLVDGKRQAGEYSVSFDASTLSSGVYIYRLKIGKFIKARKMILLK